jgi:aspartate kinase
MKIFKFGGASLKDPDAVRNMATILKNYQHENLVIVVSAMAKTTNALERLLQVYSTEGDFQAEIKTLRNFHSSMISALLDDAEPVIARLDEHLDDMIKVLHTEGDDDWKYDQVVSAGEVISSVIVHAYLESIRITATWADARTLILTDNTFREGQVNWTATEQRINQFVLQASHNLILTQGFIGADVSGNTTTLGREGSDFTAAIFGSCLKAESVTIWKDVPGVMNADPKRLPAAIVFEELPYSEAAEMTYYGASVIHPKTIKPLALSNIPLYVKSFTNTALPGTKIHACKIDNLPPLIVFKDNQCLVSCKVTDFTFINEEQLSTIFHALSELNIKLNVMQNSAISFSFCIDFRERKLTALLNRLQSHFEVYYNTNLTLITIKNYDGESMEEYRTQPGIVLEQFSRSTLQVLVKG